MQSFSGPILLMASRLEVGFSSRAPFYDNTKPMRRKPVYIDPLAKAMPKQTSGMTLQLSNCKVIQDAKFAPGIGAFPDHFVLTYYKYDARYPNAEPESYYQRWEYKEIIDCTYVERGFHISHHDGTTADITFDTQCQFNRFKDSWKRANPNWTHRKELSPCEIVRRTPNTSRKHTRGRSQRITHNDDAGKQRQALRRSKRNTSRVFKQDNTIKTAEKGHAETVSDGERRSHVHGLNTRTSGKHRTQT